MKNQNNGQLVGDNQAYRVNGYGRLTKLDFHKFSGDDVKGMFKPRTLADTYCLANLQEATNESRTKPKPVYTNFRNVASTSSGSYGRGNMNSSNNKPLLALLATKQTINPGRKQLSEKEYEEKRAKNQCFYCDQNNLSFANAGGSELVSQYVCKSFKWKLQSETFESDSMILPLGGCEMATMKRLAAYFYWKGLKKMVKQKIYLCDIYQRNKPDLSAYPRLLQPFQIPNKVWQDISMDFTEALPMSQNKSVILVVDNVYKLHGLPSITMSDRDKCVKTYLRCMTGERPKEWMKRLSLAEYWYNTNFHNFIKTTPFEVLYGQTPPIHNPYVAKDSSMELVDRTLKARDQVIAMLKFHLKAAQDNMKTYADKKRSEREFAVGDLVYLKLQSYRQLTLRVHKLHKLSAKFFGPFKVSQKVGRVAYKLELPSTTSIHPVFYVSLLKKMPFH
nr:hypothetical protein [Tanacetum cinerariifolium]